MLDPALQLLICSGIGLLFIIAARHKLGDLRRFEGVLKNYRLLPAGLIPLAAICLVLTELLAGLAMLFRLELQVVAIACAGLLMLYATAMAINLVRGRSYIDCGCGFSTLMTSNSEGQHGQQISRAMVLRNLLLSGLALIAILPTTDRGLGWLDFVVMLFALLTLALAYAAFNQLARNGGAIASWRNVSD